MDIEDRLDILADAAKYDVSCSSSGSSRPNRPGGLGNAHYSGICHSWTADGRCISLLKILMTNSCIYDCEYCVNRRSNDTPRAMLTPADTRRPSASLDACARDYSTPTWMSTTAPAA